MTIEEFTHILNEIKPYTKTIYLHVKGEPLLHPEIERFLQLADENAFRVNITTNATLLSKSIELLNHHSSGKKLNISLHAEYLDADIYEKIWNSVSLLRSDIAVIYRLWTLNGETLDKKSTKFVEKLIDFTIYPQMLWKN